MRAETGTFEDRSMPYSPVVPSSPWSIVALGVLPEWRMKVRFLDGHEGIINMRELVFSPNAGVFASLIDVAFRASVSRIWRRHMAEWPRYRARCRARRNRKRRRMGYQPLAEHEALAFELDGNKRSAPPLRLFPGRNRRHQTQ